MDDNDLEQKDLEREAEAVVLMTLYSPDRLNAWVNSSDAERKAIDLAERYTMPEGTRQHVIKLLAEQAQREREDQERDKRLEAIAKETGATWINAHKD